MIDNCFEEEVIVFREVFVLNAIKCYQVRNCCWEGRGHSLYARVHCTKLVEERAGGTAKTWLLPSRSILFDWYSIPNKAIEYFSMVAT